MYIKNNISALYELKKRKKDKKKCGLYAKKKNVITRQ